MLNLELVLKGYVDAALWSTYDESDDNGGDPMDKNYGFEDVELSTLEVMREDCRKFITANESDLIEENFLGHCHEGTFEEYVGHDFWLTRNGHGCGFWDGDWVKEVGERLTKHCKYKEFYLFVNDGKISH